MSHVSLLARAGCLVLLAALPGCQRSLDTADVRAFIDQADEVARKRYAPEICALRGKDFTQQLRYEALDGSPPKELEISRQMYCREAGKFARLRQYRLERRSLDVEVAADHKTASVVAEYTETLPYYENEMPTTPDDFRQFVIIESRDESVVGIEDGDIVFLSTKVDAQETELVNKSTLNIPYD